MSNVIPLSKARKSPKQQHKGKTLCRHGFHKWIVKQDKQFDSRQGRLVTIYRCERCGKEKVEAH